MPSGITDIAEDVSSVRKMLGKDDKNKPREPRAKPRYVDVPSFKRGGKMKRRGVAKLHKGERIRSRR